MGQWVVPSLGANKSHTHRAPSAFKETPHRADVSFFLGLFLPKNVRVQPLCKLCAGSSAKSESKFFVNS